MRFGGSLKIYWDARVEFAHPGESAIPGRSLWKIGRVVVTSLIVVTNLFGITAVVLVTSFVVPRPAGTGSVDLRNAIAGPAFGFMAFGIGIVFGPRGVFDVKRWLVEDRPATAREQRTVLRAPLRLFVVQAVFWVLAAFLFGVLDGLVSVTLGLTESITIATTGIVTASCAYLLNERVLRSAAARALRSGTPERLAVPGVATRAVLAWAMGTGLVVTGLVAIGVHALASPIGSRHQLAVAMVSLGGIGIVVGLLTVTLAARATADPVDTVTRALEQVQRGRLDVSVSVYDGTQIGKLQLGFNQMVAGLAERERIRSAFGTYVDHDVAQLIIEEGTDLSGEQVEVTVMFVDVRGFTAFSEKTPAPIVVAALNRLFEVVVPIIQSHNGRVDKFIGDGLLAVFGTPRRLADHADRALAAALDIAGAVTAGRSGELAVGIGLNSGEVVAGNLGGAGRFEFGVIGDPVNVAARVEAATRQTGDTILVSDRTASMLRSDHACEMVERLGIELKGKRDRVRVFAVVPAGLDTSDEGDTPRHSKPEIP